MSQDSSATLLGTMELQSALSHRGGAIRRTLVVGSGPRAARFYQELTSGSDATARREVAGCVDFDGEQVQTALPTTLVDSVDTFERLLVKKQIDEVFVALPLKSRYQVIQDIVDACDRLGIEVRFPSDLFRFSNGTVESESSGLSIKPRQISKGYAAIKRVADVVVSLVALLLCVPVFAAIAAAIKLTSAGPVFFIQDRIGLNRRRFSMFKFRSMREDAEVMIDLLESMNESGGPTFKIRQDPRITTVGAFLRRTSLDELPQLINVLLGDMSLVGPRPLPVRDVSRFTDPRHIRRFSFKPGITCLWQVSGRSDVPFADWMSLDMEYIDKWSPLLDLKILLQTLPAVLRRHGAA